ncbi:MAG: hypothetical protein M1482_03225, partial [Chloroflexi bacterium]|nr:hypothetical protein [Chloroflexota bacterium]
KDWEAFKHTESFFVSVWDNDAGAYVTGTTLTRFVNKNFGGGVWAEPKFPGPVTGGAYGAVTISPAAGQVKLKGEMELTIAILDKQQEPVADTEVEVVVMGTAAGSRVAPKATSTDDAGNARVTFTAGSKDGVAVVVARSRGTYGAATVKVGKGDKDPAGSGVTAELAQKGYKVYGAGVSADDPDTSYVDMDMVGVLLNPDGSYDPQTLAQIVDGWTALGNGYPKAKLLVVITRYQAQYGIHWSVKPEDLTAYVDKTLSADDFWVSQFDGIVVYDLNTGKEVSTKDFTDKNFGSE